MSDDGIQLEDHPSTWTTRNPDKPVIQSRVHAKKSLTASQKISNAEKQAMKHEAGIVLHKKLDEFNIERDEFIEKVTKDTMKKPSHIRDLLLSQSKRATPRKASLHNALTHYVAKELNAGEYCFFFFLFNFKLPYREGCWSPCQIAGNSTMPRRKRQPQKPLKKSRTRTP